MNILKKVDEIDRAIIKLYPAFDYPVDRLIVDEESLARFCYAVRKLTEDNIPCHDPEYADMMQNRLLYLRKRAADRRREGLPALARIGRKWKGPNQSNLDAAVDYILDERKTEGGVSSLSKS